jgi:hypothetical protein
LKSTVGIRIGYWNDEVGRRYPVTFGGSLRIREGQFDFSYVRDTGTLLSGDEKPIDGTTRFTFSLTF